MHACLVQSGNRPDSDLSIWPQPYMSITTDLDGVNELLESEVRIAFDLPVVPQCVAAAIATTDDGP